MNIFKHQVVSENAPKPAGLYSQAIRVGNIIYLSGQIGQNPISMELVCDEIGAQIRQVFENIASLCKEAGGDLNSIVKLTCYMTDLACIPILNDTIKNLLVPPYPARTGIQISALPKDAKIEIEAVIVV